MMKRIFLSTGLAALVAAGNVQAAEPKALGRNGDWEAYYYESDGQKVCYMLSAPEELDKEHPDRKAYVFVTHRPKGRQFDEVTFDNGYTFMPGSRLELKIEDKTYKLSTDKQRAWADTVRTDLDIVAAMKKGLDMTASGRSSLKKNTIDTYSLKGFTATYRLINNECR